jgi:hypothetical protein
MFGCVCTHHSSTQVRDLLLIVCIQIARPESQEKIWMSCSFYGAPFFHLSEKETSDRL